MFLKKTTSKGNQYLQIVKGFREDGKVKQKIVANLGRVDILSENGLENIVQALSNFIDKQDSTLKNISTMKEIARVNYGYAAYKKLWDNFELNKLLSEFGTKVEFDFANTVFSMVISRLLNPSSKLFLFNTRDKYYDLNNSLKLENLYRGLDILSDNKEEIELKLFEKNINLFNMKIDIVFYDVTTYYFESQRGDELKNQGYSKDCKVNDVQVVMGLLVDKEGRPVGYELFKGNTAESKTLIETIKKLRKKFNVDTVVLVADRGINTKINLKELVDNGFDYIVSSRIKKLPKKIREEVINREGYTGLSVSPFVKEEKDIFEYKVMNYVNEVEYEEAGSRYVKKLNEVLVCSYSSKRANKDRRDRERQIEKANEAIQTNNKSAVSNKKGYRKYFETVKNIESLKLDLAKIEEEERFDGFYAIQTSGKDLSPMEVLNNYHNLYKIEESFRVLKSTMKTRPVYHYTPRRIEGHFVVCFLGFLLERELEYRLSKSKKTNDEIISPEKIRRALNSMEFSVIEIENEQYYLRSNHESLASKIFSLLKIKQPGHLSSKEEIKFLFE